MRRRRVDESPKARQKYERSYGDADAGGWAPRRRSEDESERSRYSSQRDQQEDRAGFTRGYQGEREIAERHAWGKVHAHGDELLDDAPGKRPLSAAESVAGPEEAARKATKLKLKPKRQATRGSKTTRAAKRSPRPSSKTRAGAKRTAKRRGR